MFEIGDIVEFTDEFKKKYEWTTGEDWEGVVTEVKYDIFDPHLDQVYAMWRELTNKYSRNGYGSYLTNYNSKYLQHKYNKKTIEDML